MACCTPLGVQIRMVGSREAWRVVERVQEDWILLLTRRAALLRLLGSYRTVGRRTCTCGRGVGELRSGARMRRGGACCGGRGTRAWFERRSWTSCGLSQVNFSTWLN